ncbi:MAG TPA: RnfABCDGE type electron transport complex subunit B [Gammaproteobacteria bacterium]|jgi:electron transport complex protein RnfB|nr:RnfABCDGE type electron transport complex subunit B [Gammaproteobacteria bacterium]
MSRISPEDIDAILPQTQCGLCGHGGCMPYAEALIYENAEINLCPPGGIPVMHKLGEMLNRNPAPFKDEMLNKAKPEFTAVIRESECIGCTKCIAVCPVDAILGSAKSMHTIIKDECTGCELCIPPCPVDCIDLIEIAPAKLSAEDNINESTRNQYRNRYLAREKRLEKDKKRQMEKKLQSSIHERKNYILAAAERARVKKTI